VLFPQLRELAASLDLFFEYLFLQLKELRRERSDCRFWQHNSCEPENRTFIVFSVLARDKRPYMAKLVEIDEK